MGGSDDGLHGSSVFLSPTIRVGWLGSHWTLRIGVIYFTDKDTEGGRHQRFHRSSPGETNLIMISEVLSNSVEWFHSSFPPSVSSLSVSRPPSLKRFSNFTVIHRYMGNPRRSEKKTSLWKQEVLNISLSSNAGRLDVQFDEGRFRSINWLIGKAGSVALDKYPERRRNEDVEKKRRS